MSDADVPEREEARAWLSQQAAEVVQRLGATRLGVASIGRLVSPIHRLLYRISKGRISLTGQSPVLLLTTTGRQTGKPRTIPVFYVHDGDRIIVCNVTPPSERSNPWTLNLRDTPEATVQIGDTIRGYEAREATEAENTRYWVALTELWPAYQRFFDLGGKRSIFVLEPLEPSRRDLR